MPNERKGSPRSQAIYLDTCCLYGLPEVDLGELEGIAKYLGIKLFLPEMAFRELIVVRREIIFDCVKEYEEKYKKLAELLNSSDVDVKYEKPEITQEIAEKIVRNYLSRKNIDIIPTPSNIPFEELINMSIEHEAPFQKGDKGFKDTIILFTIIEHMLSRKFSTAIFMSKDIVFLSEKFSRQFRNKGLNVLVVKNFSEGIKKIEGQLDEAVKTYIENKKEKIKLFLDSKFDQIKKYVLENAQISPFFLKGGLFISKNPIPGCIINKIRAVRPKEISDVYPGLALMEKSLPEGFEPVTFGVSTEFALVVETIESLNEPRFLLSAPEQFEKIKYQYPEPIEKEVTVNYDILVEGVISLKEGRYSELELRKVLAY